MSTTETGARGERIAERFLAEKGYAPLARNYRSGRCEIDLVMHDGAYVVFVEVKARSGARFGTPAEAVNLAKQQRLIAAAQAYLIEHGMMDSPARFDVVSVYLSENRVEHIENAFGI